MAVGAAVVAGAGLALNVHGQIKAGKEKEAAAREESNARRAQANEILSRSELNIKALKREAEGFKAKQAVAFAASGVALGEGAPLVTLENTNRVLVGVIDNRRREARYQAEAALRGANIASQTGRDIRKASQMQAAGQGLAGLGQILSTLK